MADWAKMLEESQHEVEDLKRALLDYLNNGACATCPICYGQGVAPFGRIQVREELLEKYREPITQEELDEFSKKRAARYLAQKD